MAEPNAEHLETRLDEKLRVAQQDNERRFSRIDEKLVDLAATPWGTIASVAAVVILVLGGIWGLISTRFETGEKADQALTHEVERINDDLVRRRAEFASSKVLEALEKRIDIQLLHLDQHMADLLTRAAFEAWKTERDEALREIRSDIRRLEDQRK